MPYQCGAKYGLVIRVLVVDPLIEAPNMAFGSVGRSCFFPLSLEICSRTLGFCSETALRLPEYALVLKGGKGAYTLLSLKMASCV